MRQTLLVLLIGAIALAEESDAFATGDEVKLNQTVTTTANETVTVAANVPRPTDAIPTAINNNGTGAGKNPREIAFGDEMAQLFFGEAAADSMAKGSGPGVVTRLETVAGGRVQVVPFQQNTANAGTAFESLAIPADGTVGAEEGIQQTVKNVEQLITQVQQQQESNFGVAAGDSFTAGEAGKLFPTDETTAGQGFQMNVASVQETVTPSAGAGDPFQIEHKQVSGAPVDPNTGEAVGMQSSVFNFSGAAAKQIPIFIHSKIKHAVFNIHVQTSTPSGDSSLEIGGQLPAIQLKEMPNLTRVAPDEGVDLPDLFATTSSASGTTASLAEVGSFEIDKIIVGGVNQTAATPADAFSTADAMVARINGGRLLLVQQQPANIQNVISDERAMRSPLASLSIRPNPAQQVNGGHAISGDAFDDLSLEVIGFIPHNQRRIENQTAVGKNNQRPVLLVESDGPLSAQVLGDMNENHRGGNRQNGRVQTHHSGEIDTSVENADIRTNLSRHSDEQDDTSLEVNFDLLPVIQRLLLRPQPQSKGKRPEMVFFQHSGEQDDALELDDILANPLFQRKLHEMDDRLKSAPAARGKRLMEKYAEALATSSRPSAAATVHLSFHLPLLSACLLVNRFS